MESISLIDVVERSLDDHRTMKKERVRMLLIFGVLALIVEGIWLALQAREKHNAAEREATYQRILADCQSALRPGTTRGEVEQHFHAHETQFKHMCCVCKTCEPSATYDDLVKVGQESAPWFCSEHTVYIAFEFNPKSQSEAPETNDSDTLKRVSIFHQLEGCL
jgi:hypothetical protein